MNDPRPYSSASTTSNQSKQVLFQLQVKIDSNLKATNTLFECKVRQLKEPPECIKKNQLWISTWEKHNGLCFLSPLFLLSPRSAFQPPGAESSRGVLSVVLFSLPSSCLSGSAERKEVELGPNLLLVHVNVNVCGLGSSSPPDKEGCRCRTTTGHKRKDRKKERKKGKRPGLWWHMPVPGCWAKFTTPPTHHHHQLTPYPNQGSKAGVLNYFCPRAQISPSRHRA